MADSEADPAAAVVDLAEDLAAADLADREAADSVDRAEEDSADRTAVALEEEDLTDPTDPTDLGADRRADRADGAGDTVPTTAAASVVACRF